MKPKFRENAQLKQLLLDRVLPRLNILLFPYTSILWMDVWRNSKLHQYSKSLWKDLGRPSNHSTQNGRDQNRNCCLPGLHWSVHWFTRQRPIGLLTGIFDLLQKTINFKPFFAINDKNTTVKKSQNCIFLNQRPIGLLTGMGCIFVGFWFVAKNDKF